MATSAQSFRQKWRIGRSVQVNGTRLKGTIRAVRGTGANANINVAIPGRVPANYRPAQLTPL